MHTVSGAYISPLAPDFLTSLPSLDGLRFYTFESGIRYKNRPDVFYVEFDRPVSVGGVLTRSLTRSAAVDQCRSALTSGLPAKALLVNAGNSNAFTGSAGLASVQACLSRIATLASCTPEQIFLSSTGVIGVPLEHERILEPLGSLLGTHFPKQDWLQAAKAIGTTDTFPKLASRTFIAGGKRYTINGIAKGSGMIAPDMATMLAYCFTDAPVQSVDLQRLVQQAADKSFNAITVDSDTSTSDTFLVFATGTAEPLSGEALKSFSDALNALTLELALMIVRDGEGAQKLITVHVTGAVTDHAARRIGFSIANSPLVKTAIAGQDASWGRVVAAVGKAGEAADRDKLSIAFGGIRVAADGQVVPNYDERPVADHLKGTMIDIAVDVGVGSGSATVYTCDLTQRYLEINAGYRS